jgi:Flp pilus assembly pilin Flp
MLKKILIKLLGEKRGSQTLETIVIAVLVAALAVGVVGILGNKTRTDLNSNLDSISTKTVNSINSLSN